MRVNTTAAIQIIMDQVEEELAQQQAEVARVLAYDGPILQPQKDLGPLTLPLKDSGPAARKVNISI
jgi:hypothetical protein